MRPRLAGIVCLAASAVLVPAASAEWLDAASLASAGIPVGGWLDTSPASAAPVGLRLGASHAERFVGSSVRADAVRMQWGTSGWATAVSWGELRSDVHRESVFCFAAQHRRDAWRAGASAVFSLWRFDPSTPVWAARQHLGVALEMGEMLETVLQLDMPLRVVTAVRLHLGDAAQLVAQQERAPGFEPRSRLALRLGRLLRFVAGYDALVQAPSVGFVLEQGVWQYSYGTESHPQLGWSHAWSLVIRGG